MYSQGLAWQLAFQWKIISLFLPKFFHNSFRFTEFIDRIVFSRKIISHCTKILTKGSTISQSEDSMLCTTHWRRNFFSMSDVERFFQTSSYNVPTNIFDCIHIRIVNRCSRNNWRNFAIVLVVKNRNCVETFQNLRHSQIGFF